jgi:hypothetical protein
MAGHIGFELRCAGSKFISLDTGQYLRFKHLAETEFVPPGNYFLHVEGLLVARYRSEAPPAVFQCRSRRSSNPLNRARQNSKLRPIRYERRDHSMIRRALKEPQDYSETTGFAL